MLLVCCLLLLSAALSRAADVQNWLTQVDPSSGSALHLLEQLPDLTTTNKDGKRSKDVTFSMTISMQTKMQKIVGYGAGLSQSSAYVLNSLKQRNATLYQETLQALFSPITGAGLRILRFPIGSCDFSLRNTSYDEYQDDYDLTHFAVDADSQAIISVLLDVRAVNKDLIIIASPWSAPSWLKTFDTLIAYSNSNTLTNDEKTYQTYAKYLSKVLQTFSVYNVPIDYLTLQNEPLFGTGSEYLGMYLSSEQAVKLAAYLTPLLKAGKTDKTPKTKLLAYDHNWDHPEYPMDFFSSQTTDNHFSGVAWHCYGGSMSSAHEQVHTAYPDIPQWVTECTGSFPDGVCDINLGMDGFGFNHEWDMNNILLGASSHWAVAGIKWILALDEGCGPVLSGVSYTTGRPLVSIPSNSTQASELKYNQDYYSLAHLSKFIGSGMSSRVGSSKSGSSINSVLAEAFYSDSTGIMNVIAMNNDHDNSQAMQMGK